MYWQSMKLRWLALTALVLGQALLGTQGAAQQRGQDPNVLVRPSEPSSVPKSKRGTRAPKTAVVKNRGGRRPVPPKCPETAPAPANDSAVATQTLTLEWQILKARSNRANTGVTQVNPGSEFNPGDELRFAIKASENGYFYIIQQSLDSGDGKVLSLYLDSLCDKDIFNIEKEQLLTFPKCGKRRELCWYALSKTRNTPVEQERDYEVFTLIFSRKKIEFLSQKAVSGGVVTAQEIKDLRSNLMHNLKRSQGTSNGRYAIMLTNNNIEDYSIFEPIPLKRNQRALSQTTR
jgi:hypothetical protein